MNIFDPITLLIIVLIVGLFGATVWVYIDSTRAERGRQNTKTPPPASPTRAARPAAPAQAQQSSAGQRTPAASTPAQSTGQNQAQAPAARRTSGSPFGRFGLRPRESSRPKTNPTTNPLIGSTNTRTGSRPPVVPPNTMGTLSSRWSRRMNNIMGRGSRGTRRVTAPLSTLSARRGNPALADDEFGNMPTRKYVVSDASGRRALGGAISANDFQIGSEDDYLSATGAIPVQSAAPNDIPTARPQPARPAATQAAPAANFVDADGDGIGGDAEWDIPEHASELGNVDGFETRPQPPRPARATATAAADASPDPSDPFYSRPNDPNLYQQISAEAEAAGYDSGDLVDEPVEEITRRNSRFGLGRIPRRAYNTRRRRRTAAVTSVGPRGIIGAVIAVMFVLIVVFLFGSLVLRGTPLASESNRLVVFVSPLGDGQSFAESSLSRANAERLRDAITAAINNNSGLDPKNVLVQTINQKPISNDADARAFLSVTGGNADMVVWGYTDPARNLAFISISQGYNGPYTDTAARNDMARRMLEPQTIQLAEALPSDPTKGVTPGTVQAVDTDSATAQAVVALAHYFRGDYPAALTYITNAQRSIQQTYLGGLSFWRANTDLALGNYSIASNEYNQALDAGLQGRPAAPTSYIYNNRGVAEWRGGQFDEANRDFIAAQNGLQPDPLNPATLPAGTQARVWSNQGIAKMTLSTDQAGALQSLERAYQLDSTNPVTNSQLAELYRRVGRSDEAATLLDSTIKQDNSLPRPHITKGYILLDKGKIDEANTEFDTARRLTDELVNRYQADATRANGVGDTNRNVYSNRRADSYNAEQESINIGQARVLLERGRKEGNVQGGALDGVLRGVQGKKTQLEQAEDAFRAVVARNPKSFEGHYYLGETLRLKGDVAGAAAEYDSARTAAAATPEVYPTLADSFFAINQPDKALAVLSEFVQKYPGDTSYKAAIEGFLVANKLPQAQAQADTWLKQNPGSATANYMKGRVLIQQGKLKDAQDALEQAVRLNDRLTDAWYNLGNVTFALGNRNRAYDAYSRTVDLAPNSFAKAYYFLGIIYDEDRKDPQRAISAWQSAVRINPTQDDALFRLGLVYANNGRYGDSVDAFQRAINARPDKRFPEAYFQLGQVQLRQNNLAESEKNFRAALNQQPNLIDAQTRLSDVLLLQGKTDEATTIAQQAATANPRNLAANLSLGNALFAKNDFDNANKAYTAAAALDPNSPQAVYGQGRVLLEIGRRNRDINRINSAIGYFDQAIKRDANYAAAYVARGQADLAKDDQASAATDFAQAVRLDPRNTAGWVGQGDALRASNPSQAIASYKQALTYNANDPDAHYGLAQTYGGQAKPDWAAAANEYQAAVKARPTWPEAYYYLGKAYLSLNRADDAKKAFRNAADQKPTFVEAHFELGNIAYNSGQRDEAIKEYDAALKVDPKYAPAWLQEGLSYEYLSRPQDAIKAYKQAYATSSDPTIRAQAQSGLTRLGAQP